MNWVEFAETKWPFFFHLVVLHAMITGTLFITNVIMWPELPNWPLYIFVLQTIGISLFFIFLWNVGNGSKNVTK